MHAKGIGSDNGDSGLVADAHGVCTALTKGHTGIIDVAYSIFTAPSSGDDNGCCDESRTEEHPRNRDRRRG